MLDDINILKMASAMARHATNRHQLLAQNVANADTPNYKAKDLEPFAEAYSRLSDRLHENDAPSTEAAPWRTQFIEGAGVASPNGNTVSIEDQLMRAADAQQRFDAATAIYRKMTEILRISLGRNA